MDNSSIPGTRRLRWAARWFDPAVVHGVFEPLVADAQRVWFNAPTPWSRARARWSGNLAFVIASAWCLPRQWWRPVSRDLVSPALGWCLAFTVGGACCALALEGWLYHWPSSPVAFAWLMPGAFVFGVPFACLFIGFEAGRAMADAHLRRTFVVQAWAVVLVVLIVGLGWVGPIANQGFRIAEAEAQHLGFVPARGAAELTLPQLVGWSALPDGAHAPPGDVHLARHARLSLGVLSITMTLFGWGLAAAGRRRSRLAAAGWWLTLVTTHQVLTSANHELVKSFGAPAVSHLWLPVILFSIGAYALQSRAMQFDHEARR